MKKIIILLFLFIGYNLNYAGNCELGKYINYNVIVSGYSSLSNWHAIAIRDGIYTYSASCYLLNNRIYADYLVIEPGTYKLTIYWDGYNSIGQYGGWQASSSNFDYTCDHDDLSFIGDVDADNDDDLVMVNTNYSGGAIKAINLIDGYPLVSLNHPGYSGMMDPTDRMFLGDVNADNKDDLVLVNTSYSGAAIVVKNLTTGGNIAYLNHPGYSGWMDAADRMFLGDVNGDNKDDLVLVNTSYSGGAIRAINLTTGENIIWIDHGSFAGWMDATDRMFLGDVNADNKEDLVLVNTSYSSGAIRAIDLNTGGNIAWLNHPGYGGMMDATDRMFLGDVNADNKDDLVMVNTDYSGTAIFVKNITTGGNIASLNHPGYAGMMDASDRMFLEDINGDNKADLVMVNTNYSGTAVFVKNITTGGNLAYISHGSFSSYMDCIDKMFIAKANSDNNKEIVLVNAGYSHGLKAMEIMDQTMVATLGYTYFLTWIDGVDNNSNCYSDIGFKSTSAEMSNLSPSRISDRDLIITYPNPVDDLLTMSIQQDINTIDYIRIYDISGQLVSQISEIQYEMKVNTSGFSKGLYIITVMDSEGIRSYKFVKN